ncbi:MAG: ArsR/SmtB family transcription factor [Candidatus Ranarchaeia archaeon]
MTKVRMRHDRGSVLLALLAHPDRRVIIAALGNRELTFNQLKRILDVSSPSLSQHLRYLRPLLRKGDLGYRLSDRGQAAHNLLRLFPEGAIHDIPGGPGLGDDDPDIWDRIHLPEKTQTKIETARLFMLFTALITAFFVLQFVQVLGTGYLFDLLIDFSLSFHLRWILFLVANYWPLVLVLPMIFRFRQSPLDALTLTISKGVTMVIILGIIVSGIILATPINPFTVPDSLFIEERIYLSNTWIQDALQALLDVGVILLIIIAIDRWITSWVVRFHLSSVAEVLGWDLDPLLNKIIDIIDEGLIYY